MSTVDLNARHQFIHRVMDRVENLRHEARPGLPATREDIQACYRAMGMAVPDEVLDAAIDHVAGTVASPGVNAAADGPSFTTLVVLSIVFSGLSVLSAHQSGPWLLLLMASLPVALFGWTCALITWALDGLEGGHT